MTEYSRSPAFARTLSVDELERAVYIDPTNTACAAELAERLANADFDLQEANDTIDTRDEEITELEGTVDDLNEELRNVRAEASELGLDLVA